ncbi:PEP-CTERM sorting domain-containing protein [Tautonia plasticadhaerens]|uniref:Ice-binding protein C-terminal domain-containing protein n=1 Tax=Tautonia plasticadhaerens TaxID=2527974 RepID=A0A518GZ81_9BACT|nr:PEP-CTERM sorting domain-containing protein [Tautonia plasticadhaerens]QDV33897.1 hypothetical protein ElP_17770 [Tautonia plasticadhaerens]
MMTRRRPAPLLALAALLALPAAPAAAEVLYETGFEEPVFTAGLLDGQDGFSAIAGPGAGIVSTSNPSSGDQAVEILGAGLEDLGGLYFSAFDKAIGFTAAPGMDVIDVVADVRLDRSTGGTTADDSVSVNLSAFANDFDLLADVYVSSNGTIVGSVSSGDTFSTTGGLGSYFTLKMSIDFGARAVGFYVDDALIQTLLLPGSITDDTLSFVSLSMISVLPTLDERREFSGSIDNLGVGTPTASVVIPEPGSIVLAGIGALGLAARLRPRRRN